MSWPPRGAACATVLRRRLAGATLQNRRTGPLLSTVPRRDANLSKDTASSDFPGGVAERLVTDLPAN
jgi:hypothetical protein